MITHVQSGGDGFWVVTVNIDDILERSHCGLTYVPLPPVIAQGVSRVRNKALAYALEELAQKLKEAE